MLIYFVILVITIFLYRMDKHSRKFALLVMLLLFLITAFRDISIGIDTNNYVSKYKFRYNEYTSEFLFNNTYNLIHTIGGSPQLWLFFVSLLIYIPYTYVICKYSKVPMMSVLIFLTSSSLFFFDGMNGIRQWIASGVILLALVLRSYGKVKIPVLLVFCAAAFHLSSIIAFPFLFITFFTMGRKLAYAIIVSIAILGILISHFDTSGIFDFYGYLIEGYEGEGMEKLNAYSRYEDMENTTNWKYYVFNILPLSFMCLAAYVEVAKDKATAVGAPRKKQHKLLTKALSTEKENAHYLYIVFLTGVVLLDLLLTTIAYGHRLAFCILTSQLICLPNGYVYGGKKQRLFINLVLCFFMLWYMYYVYRTNGSRIGSTVPYKFFWE